MVFAVGKNVIVIGGGLAGLAASIYLARAGRTVTLFERRRFLGGRAVTQVRLGYRFNLGPHAVYRRGAATSVYRELGVPIRGGTPPAKGTALYGGSRYALPAGLWSLLTTSLLTPKAKLEAAALMLRIRMLEPIAHAARTVSEWLDAYVRDNTLRRVMEAFFRLSTYADHPDEQSASAALSQMKIAQAGVVYVDEGWQKLVDALHSHAVAAGVNFVTSARVVGVDHVGFVRGIEIGELELDEMDDTASVAFPILSAGRLRGTRIPAETVLLTVDPATASDLVGDALGTSSFTPVTLACLDIALSRLPVAKETFAVGIDRPLYFSVHSAHAQLTPRGGALIHVAKYRRTPVALSEDVAGPAPQPGGDADADERELEALLDQLQPGWRDVVVHRRFLPSMTVSNALVKPHTPRPSPRSPIQGLYLAGDWIGETGLLSDAALASARAAAKAILSDTE